MTNVSIIGLASTVVVAGMYIFLAASAKELANIDDEAKFYRFLCQKDGETQELQIDGSNESFRWYSENNVGEWRKGAIEYPKFIYREAENITWIVDLRTAESFAVFVGVGYSEDECSKIE